MTRFRTFHFVLPALFLPLSLGACAYTMDDEEQEEKASAESDSSTDKTKFSIKAEGFNLDMDVPGAAIKVGEGDDDLYPGSTMTGIDIRADAMSDSNGKAEKSNKVILSFAAPAATDTVADWFADKFTRDGGKVSRKGDNLSGSDKDGDAFTLELSEDGADKSKGVLTVTD